MVRVFSFCLLTIFSSATFAPTLEFGWDHTCPGCGQKYYVKCANPQCPSNKGRCTVYHK